MYSGHYTDLQLKELLHLFFIKIFKIVQIPIIFIVTVFHWDRVLVNALKYHSHGFCCIQHILLYNCTCIVCSNAIFQGKSAVQRIQLQLFKRDHMKCLQDSFSLTKVFAFYVCFSVISPNIQHFMEASNEYYPDYPVDVILESFCT